MFEWELVAGSSSGGFVGELVGEAGGLVGEAGDCGWCRRRAGGELVGEAGDCGWFRRRAGGEHEGGARSPVPGARSGARGGSSLRRRLRGGARSGGGARSAGDYGSRADFVFRRTPWTRRREGRAASDAEAAKRVSCLVSETGCRLVWSSCLDNTGGSSGWELWVLWCRIAMVPVAMVLVLGRIAIVRVAMVPDLGRILFSGGGVGWIDSCVTDTGVSVARRGRAVSVEPFFAFSDFRFCFVGDMSSFIVCQLRSFFGIFFRESGSMFDIAFVVVCSTILSKRVFVSVSALR